MKKSNGAVVHDQPSVDIADVVKELDAIKRLLVLMLMKGGSSGREIAKALDIHESTVSRQFRVGDVKPLAVEVAAEE